MTLPDRLPKKPKRETRWRSPSHRAFIRSFACAMCGSRTNIEAAHVRIGSGAGTGQKPDDYLAVPLCAGPFANIDGELGCHNEQHMIGESTFWKRYEAKSGQTVWTLLDELIDASPKRREIEQIIKERNAA